MTPAARLQATIDLLDRLNASAMPADRYIREFFRARRYAGSKDRAAVADRAFAILRRRASLAWRMQSETPRALVIAGLLSEGSDLVAIEALFSGEGYGPQPLGEDERAAILSPARESPLHVRGEYPEFLDGELRRAFGERLLDEMQATQTRASIDLRVNTLKTTRDELLAALQAEGYAAEPTRHSPFAVRIPSGEGSAALSRSKLFERGAFEFQDEAAQIAVMLSGAKPGMRVLDLAAGAGGKSLALAAMMANTGEITAHDIDEGRLRQIAPRAARAGISIIETHAGQAPPKRPFDLVFLDAPCSGSGTWRRQPENKWRLTASRLDELNALQDMLLDQAAARAAGRAAIVYATCSILPRENEDRVGAFLARHPAFAVRPAAAIWRELVDTEPPPGAGEFFRASPLSTGTDGFFAAVLARN